MKLRNLVAALAFAFGLGSAQATVVLDNSPGSGRSICCFGPFDSATYGQVFTAPISGTMTSFTLWLDGGVVSLHGGVGTWNGTSSHGFGFGSPTNLFTSPDVASLGAGAYTFTPNINVVAGQRYVAYLSVFGDANAFGSTSMPLSSNDVLGIDYFVWNNISDPVANASWNYFFNTGDVQFAATFVPEPGPLMMVLMALVMMAGLGVMRRQAS